MADKGWVTATGRRGRLFRRAEDELDGQDADLSEDEHAWWAAREDVQAVPRGSTVAWPSAEPEPDPDPHFSDYWTARSLFDDPPDRFARAARDSDDPRSGPEPVEPAPSMDLDAAHLVLQVRVGSAWDDITAAHRRLAKLYHPDRLMAYSPDAQALGRERMAEINAAHAALRALHFR
jgi:DnaJ-domain-containing protein 1